MEEVWKDIEGYEGRYQVSNMGRVKSLNYRRSGKERILRPSKNGRGYMQVYLSKEGNHTFYGVHRLVLSAFSLVENIENLEVNHIDENKENNRLENLEWVTHKENQNHGTHNARAAAKKSIPIAQLTLDGKFVKAWESSHEAERVGGFTQTAIIACCKKNYSREGNNIYKGYRFMYLSEYMDKNCGIIN